MPGNTAAKASVDIALHDLVGKIMKQPWYKIWGYHKKTHRAHRLQSELTKMKL